MKLIEKMFLLLICLVTLLTFFGCSSLQDKSDPPTKENGISENVDKIKSFKGEIINFDKLLNQNNEIISTASPYNVTYANGNERLMYVFASPVRQKEDQSMNKIPLSIISGEDNVYSAINNQYKANFDSNCIYLDNSINKFSFYLGTRLTDARKSEYIGIYNYPKETIAYLNNQIEIYTYPSFSGIAFDFNYIA